MRMGVSPYSAVIAGLDPAIHLLREAFLLMDARVKPAHDEGSKSCRRAAVGWAAPAPCPPLIHSVFFQRWARFALPTLQILARNDELSSPNCSGSPRSASDPDA